MLQKDDFPRIRIGIGKSSHLQLADYVLQRFTKDEMIEMNETIDRAAEAVTSIIEFGADHAMNRFNG